MKPLAAPLPRRTSGQQTFAALKYPVILTVNLANALVQTLTPDVLRGRVMSIYSLTFFGSMPIGALWVGAVAERMGEPPAVMISAVIALGCAALIWVFAPRLRALE